MTSFINNIETIFGLKIAWSYTFSAFKIQFCRALKIKYK